MAINNGVITSKGRQLLPARAKIRGVFKKTNARAFRNDWKEQRAKFLSDPEYVVQLPNRITRGWAD